MRKAWRRMIGLGRTYLVMYSDGREQAQIEGALGRAGQQRSLVLEVNGRYLLVPKAQVDMLVEVE
jgi:hypothetical protein